MRIDLMKKPEGTWCSFNESCGTGDGVNKEFKTPVPAAEARGVLVFRAFDIVQSDGRVVTMNDKDGTILRDDKDGYRLETRETELWIVFDRAPALGVKVWVSCLGRQVGEAFNILPMSTLLGKKIAEGQPAIFRGPAKDRVNVTSNDLQEAGRVSFMELVTDWTGVDDVNGNPIACSAASKKSLLDNMDAMFLGIFASNRASAIRAERIQGLDKDSSD
jgi:hypothetical protein